MTLRSQTVALIVLFAVFGIVFVLVGDAGVSTGVFSPESTATLAPTPVPSPTPLPDANAENWTETTPGQLTYANPSVPAQIAYQQDTLDNYITTSGYVPPADEDPYPLINLLWQMRNELEVQARDLDLTIEPEGITGPEIEVINSRPIALVHITVEPQAMSGEQEMPGLDLARGLIDRGDGEIMIVTYALQSEPDPLAYADFRAWLEANIVELSGTPDDTDTPEADSEGVPDAAPEETPEADAETVPDEAAEETPEADAEAVPDEAAEEAPDEAPEATAPQADAAEEAPAGPWLEVAPGQYLHAESENAMIVTTAMLIDEFAAQLGTEPPAADDPAPLQTLLEFAREDMETQLAASGILVDENGIQGPQSEVYGGVPVATLQVTVGAQTTAAGQETPGQSLLIGLIDRGDGTLALFQYVYQGEPDAAVAADFETWLEENAPKLAEPEAAPEPDTSDE